MIFNFIKKNKKHNILITIIFFSISILFLSNTRIKDKISEITLNLSSIFNKGFDSQFFEKNEG